jgi:hypothetical protein
VQSQESRTCQGNWFTKDGPIINIPRWWRDGSTRHKMDLLTPFCRLLFAYSILSSSSLLRCHLLRPAISLNYCARLQWLRNTDSNHRSLKRQAETLATRSQRVVAKQTLELPHLLITAVMSKASLISARNSINFQPWTSNLHAVWRTTASNWSWSSQFSVEQCECVQLLYQGTSGVPTTDNGFGYPQPIRDWNDFERVIAVVCSLLSSTPSKRGVETS